MRWTMVDEMNEMDYVNKTKMEWWQYNVTT